MIQRAADAINTAALIGFAGLVVTSPASLLMLALLA